MKTARDAAFLAKPWRTIKKALKDATAVRVVVSAYIGSGADDLMHLESGDALYVNASVANVKAGLTDPRVLMRLVKTGVRCHSVPRLHAKVYMADGVVFIGSNNASNHSADVLTETAARIEDSAFVASVVAWIGSLPTKRLDEDAVKPLIPLYRAQPHKERRPRKRRSDRRDDTNVLWITNIKGEYEEELSENYDRWEAQSEDRVEKVDRFELFPIFFEGSRGSRLFDEVRTGDEVIVIDRDVNVVYGPMRVLSQIHRERRDGKLVRVLALEADSKQQGVRLRRFRGDLERSQIATFPESGRTERRISAQTAARIRLYLAEHAGR